MNLRQGRIGKQEAAAMAMIACISCGVFAVDAHTTYAAGDSAYVSSALAAMLSLLMFYLVAEAMRRKHCETLSQLYRLAFGRVLSVPMAFISMLALLYAAAMPLAQLLLIMNHYVYVHAPTPHIALYLLPCLLILAWMGLEIIGRTAKLLVGIILISFLVAYIIAIPAYEPFRLYPLLGNGLAETLRRSATGTVRFFPALLCLLICGRGVHGVENAASGAVAASVGGGLVASVTQLFLGMAYPYYMLADMPAPLYRLTMAVSGAKVYLRADKVLLFFWMLAGMIAGGLFAYAAALLYAGATRIRDIRPAVAAVVSVICAVALMGQLNLPQFIEAADVLINFAWLAALLPPLLASMIAVLKKEMVSA